MPTASLLTCFQYRLGYSDAPATQGDEPSAVWRDPQHGQATPSQAGNSGTGTPGPALPDGTTTVLGSTLHLRLLPVPPDAAGAERLSDDRRTPAAVVHTHPVSRKPWSSQDLFGS